MRLGAVKISGKGGGGGGGEEEAEDTGSMELALIVTRGKGIGPLGLSVSDSNVVLSVAKESASHGVLHTGDVIKAIDGKELKGRKFAAVLKPQPSHTFRVVRMNAADKLHRMGKSCILPESELKKAAAASSKPNKPPTNWFGMKKAPKQGAFGINAQNAPAWFGAGAGGVHE